MRESVLSGCFGQDQSSSSRQSSASNCTSFVSPVIPGSSSAIAGQLSGSSTSHASWQGSISSATSCERGENIREGSRHSIESAKARRPTSVRSSTWCNHPPGRVCSFCSSAKAAPTCCNKHLQSRSSSQKCVGISPTASSVPGLNRHELGACPAAQSAAWLLSPEEVVLPFQLHSVAAASSVHALAEGIASSYHANCSVYSSKGLVPEGQTHQSGPCEDKNESIHWRGNVEEEAMPILDVVTVLPSNKENKQCRVCGGAADGIYFGALVCLPCKSFFIRCTKDGEPADLKCQGARSACFPADGGRIKCQRCRYTKCLEVGMARRSEKPEVVMPPIGKTLCSVCGDIANGLHFGVMTCEGCKKFFRRSLAEASTYTCKRGQEDCPINPRTRNECRLCRYRKCLQVGMSREAIKVGRPPVAGKKESRHHPYSDASSSRGVMADGLSMPDGYLHSNPQPLPPPLQILSTSDPIPSAAESGMDFNYLLHYFNTSSALPSQQHDLGSDLDFVLAELTESCQYDGHLPELDVNAKSGAYDSLSLSASQNRSLLSDVWLQYLLGDDERVPDGYDGRQDGVESRASLQHVEGVMAALEHRTESEVSSEVAGHHGAPLIPLTFHEDADWIDDVGTIVRSTNSREARGTDKITGRGRRQLETVSGEQHSDQDTTRSDRQSYRSEPHVSSKTHIDRSAVTPVDHRAMLDALRQTWRRALRVLRQPTVSGQVRWRPTSGQQVASKDRTDHPGAAAVTALEGNIKKPTSPPGGAWRLLNELAIRSTAAWLLYFQSLAGSSKLPLDDKRALICSAAFGNTVLASVARLRQDGNDLHWFLRDCKLAAQSSGLSSWQAFHRRLERCTESVLKINPDEDECVILCALMFMTSGAGVKDKVFVEREKSVLVDLLKVSIKDVAAGTDDMARSRRMTQLLQLLPMLQHLTLWHRHLMRSKRPEQHDDDDGRLKPPALASDIGIKRSTAGAAAPAAATSAGHAVKAPPLPGIREPHQFQDMPAPTLTGN